MVIPMMIVIVGIEMIRYVFVSQKNAFVNVIAFLTCVTAEVLTYSSLAGINTFNRFMDLVGLTLFPAISANIYYHYISKHYGMLPNIALRMIITLYIYFIPRAAVIPDALSACIKIVFPIITFAFISALYDKKKKNAVKKGKAISWIGTTAAILLIVSVAMLISCQFRYGALVIATESMTGEINKGDMIIYEQYTDQTIQEGQVIVFMKDKSKIVHRVVKIENINGETRYYTKGDANEGLDSGYIDDSHIVGITDVKIAYIGYPTLWLRELIQN
jgi:signal peptidase I